jgi:hypothetical protein
MALGKTQMGLVVVIVAKERANGESNAMSV